jgi:two-component system NtrC family sensor kinase
MTCEGTDVFHGGGAHSNKPVGQGTGLGLSVCHGIVADHEGRIWAEVSPEGRALFVVELPVRAASEYAVDLPAMPPQGARPHGRRILLIDDSAVVQLVRSALGPDNLVVVAGEGAQALGRLASASFDLVLCDLKMPGMSGLDFLQRLQVAELALTRRVLFISGDTSSRATRDVITRSGLQLLSKPFTPSELYTAIAALDEAAS